MWLDSHLHHSWNAVCGWAATYSIPEMQYVAGQTLTSFLDATPTPIPPHPKHIRNSRNLFNSVENMTLSKKVDYLLRNYSFSIQHLISSHKINYLLRKYDFVWNMTFSEKFGYSFRDIICSSENMTLPKKVNYLIRKYGSFIRKYILFAES